jgi:chromate reductase
MTRLVGIAGSLRKRSLNRALLDAAVATAPAGVTLEKLAIDDVPLYNADVESASGLPEPIRAMNRAIEHAHGLVIVTPEYNAGIPGVMKNVVDWLSRSDGDAPPVIIGKRVALLGASPGYWGTFSSQSAWLPVLRRLRMRLWVAQGPFYVPSASDVIREGAVTDEALRQRLADYIAGFVAHVRAEDAAS